MQRGWYLFANEFVYALSRAWCESIGGSQGAHTRARARAHTHTHTHTHTHIQALLDEKSRASRATWGSTIQSRYQEQQLQKNRIKAAERAQRRGSGSGLSSQLAS